MHAGLQYTLHRKKSRYFGYEAMNMHMFLLSPALALLSNEHGLSHFGNAALKQVLLWNDIMEYYHPPLLHLRVHSLCRLFFYLIGNSI